jgi:uncharacterized integral membrane protein
MTRILMAIFFTAGMVVFGAQNWDHVPISLLFGAPTRIRLVFLLAIAVGAGYVTAVLRSAGREVRLRRELRELRRLLRDFADGEPPPLQREERELAPIRRRRSVPAEAEADAREERDA